MQYFYAIRIAYKRICKYVVICICNTYAVLETYVCNDINLKVFMTDYDS